MKLKNNHDKFIHFFYKDSLNDLNEIKNSNFKYKLKRCQKRKKHLSSMKEEEFEINTEKKNVEELKTYYTLMKHLITVQTLMKLDNHSTH